MGPPPAGCPQHLCPVPGVPRHPLVLTLVGGVGAGGGAGGRGVGVPARQELGVARVRPVRDGRSQAERWGVAGWHGAWGHGAAVPIPRGSRARGPPARCLPPVRAFPDLGRPGAELLLVPRLEQHIGGIGHLGDTREGHGDIREGSASLFPPPPTRAWGPDRAEHPHPAGCVPAIPGTEEEPKFGTGASSSTCAPRGGEGIGTSCGGPLLTPRRGRTLRTKVWRLSGISRRVHLRTSWTAEQAVCSFGLEPCGDESG